MTGGGDLVGEVVAAALGEDRGEFAYSCGEGGHFGAGGGQVVEVAAGVVGRLVGSLMIQETRRRGEGVARSGSARPWLM
jgi:hypothetical protein